MAPFVSCFCVQVQWTAASLLPGGLGTGSIRGRTSFVLTVWVGKRLTASLSLCGVRAHVHVCACGRVGLCACGRVRACGLVRVCPCVHVLGEACVLPVQLEMRIPRPQPWECSKLCLAVCRRQRVCTRPLRQRQGRVRKGQGPVLVHPLLLDLWPCWAGAWTSCTGRALLLPALPSELAFLREAWVV